LFLTFHCKSDDKQNDLAICGAQGVLEHYIGILRIGQSF